MSEEWWTVKGGKRNKLSGKPRSIDALLDEGYSVTNVKEEDGKTKIITYSPRTREEVSKQLRKAFCPV